MVSKDGVGRLMTELAAVGRRNRSFSPFLILLSNILIFAMPVSAHYSKALGYSSLGLLVVSIIYLGIYRHDIVISHEIKLYVAGSFAFPLATGLSMWVHGDWQWSWVDNPSRLILVLPVFLLMKHIRLNIFWLYIGILISACVFGLTAIYQSQFLGIGRANGWITDLRSPITFGNASLLFAVLSLASYTFLKQKLGFLWACLLVSMAAGLAGYASLLSGTRGGWISVPFLLMVLVATGSKRPVLANFFAIVVALLLFLLAYLGIDSVTSRIESAWHELARMFEKQAFTGGSVGTRLQMWWAAILLFMDNPLCGVGLGNYREAKLVLIDQGLLTSSIEVYSYAHSDLFHYLAEMGLIGIVPLFGFFLSCFYLVFRHIEFNQSLAVMALLILVVRFDIGLTQVQFVYHYTTTLYAMMFAVIAGLMCNPYYRNAKG